MAQPSKRRKIAIVGNVVALEDDEKRTRAEQACRELGRHLALAQYDIVVYSADRKFIEPFVVAGYAVVEPRVKGSIHVRHPEARASISFEEVKAWPDLFYWAPDQRQDWEISFYESILDVHGVLLIGGGASTLTAGLFAITRNVPALPFSSFGGTARKVWTELSSRRDLLSHEEAAILARPDFTPDLAAQAIALLDRQAERIDAIQTSSELRRAGEAKRRRAIAAVALLSFVGFLSLLVIGRTRDVQSSVVLLAFLICGPAVAGLAGVSARLLYDARETELRPEWGQLLASGLVAGGFAALLTVVPTLTARPDLPASLVRTMSPADHQAIEHEMEREQYAKLIPVAMVTGFTAGFAFDKVYRKLRKRKPGLSA